MNFEQIIGLIAIGVVFLFMIFMVGALFYLAHLRTQIAKEISRMPLPFDED